MEFPNDNSAVIRNQPGQELASTYERRFRACAAYRQQVWSRLTRHFFQAYVPTEGSVLELGCGWGEFLNQVRASTRLGMDLNREAHAHLGAGIRFLHQDCSATWPLDSDSLDTIFTSNFFEHLPDKSSLERTLEEAFRCLKRDGRLVCMGPNIRFLPGAYWDFWDHHVPLTDRSLAEILELTGFEIERCEPRFLPYTMATRRNPPPWTVSLYLKLPLLWHVYGKQFLIVARKP